MAVNLKGSIDHAVGLLALFGVPPDLIDKVKKYGVEIDQSSLGTVTVRFDGHTYGSVPIKGQAVSLAKAGTLGPASKQAIQFNLVQAVNGALVAAEKKFVPVPFADVFEDAVDGSGLAVLSESLTAEVANLYGKKVAKAVKTKVLKPETVLEQELPSFVQGGKVPIPAKFGSTPVKLCDATELYQPIIGTSHNSVYYCLAIFKGIMIAARSKGGNFSIRAEGPSLHKYASLLEDVGFSIKTDYASVHFSISEKALVRKTFGAVLGSCGFDGLVKVGDPTVIIGK